ncbi:MAG TPA: prepilin-type N-terminal cleavage/methylation domain-containing protein [Polyangia bacterium]|jgi:prepilin-type N-terminal cleavage/methylation domain-containing protein
MRASREQGFTLVELMIVVAASAIIIAGAFALHQTFNRQGDRLQKVSEVQQTLRMARQYLERRIRIAGSGLNQTNVQIAMRDPVTGHCITRTMSGIVVHNSNSLTAAATPDVTPTDADPDPDWFDFASIDVGGSPVKITGVPGSSHGDSENIDVTDNSQFGDCTNMFAISKPGGNTCLYVVKKGTGTDKININGGHCGGCLGEASGGASKKLIDCTCNNANPDYVNYTAATGKDKCESYVTGVNALSVGPGMGGVRLFPAAESPALFGMPSTMLGRGALNVATGTYDWGALTDLIDDLQLEVIMMNGQIYGSATNSMDVPAADWWKMRAIRYTMLAKSRTPAQGGFPQTIAPYADQCVNNCSFNDGFVRRLVQGTVQLRNYGL